MTKTMTRTIGVLATAMLLTGGCVSGNTPIRVAEIFPYDTTNAKAGEACKTSIIAQAEGFLDLAGSGSYITNASLDDEMISTNIKSNRGIDLNQEGSSDYVNETVHLTYTSTPKITFEQENLPYAGVLKPDSRGSMWAFEMIGPKALQKLRDNFSEQTTLLVTFEFRGHLTSGGAMSSNPFTFPIIVTQSSTTLCEAPASLAPTALCGLGPGQDGSTVLCCQPGDTSNLCTTGAP